jgi:holo-[acyl-carrier protein] synthase
VQVGQADSLEVGVDIIEIRRIAESVERFGDRFSKRIFTARELEDSAGRPASLAARFAAKEAVIKALDFTVLELTDIEVVRPHGRRPELHLAGKAAQRARAMGVTDLRLSLSHCQEYAVAMVVLRYRESSEP